VRICPTCGEENPDRARFCLTCATGLTGEAPSSQEVRKTITVLFSDLVGSTAMGERLDPESVRGVMTRYFEAMRAVIERNAGFLEKFIGDAVVARFGIPIVREDDALRAVRAAVGMREALDALNEELGRNWGVTLNVRMGLNTGEVVAGRPDADQSVVLGDAINVAARFEQAAPPGEILIGEPTYRLVRHAVEAEPVEPLSLKGKSEPVPAYRLIRVHEEAEAIPRRLDSALVGREREMESLLDAFSHTATVIEPRRVTVLGPPGVGKSRVVAELLAMVQPKATVLRGRCHQHGDGGPYGPIAEAIAPVLGGISAEQTEVAEEIGKLLAGDDRAPVVAEQIWGIVGPDEPRGPREDTFWAVAKLVEALAHTRPTVLFLDDIHWAEPITIELIDRLTNEKGAGAVLLVCAARPELVEAYPGWAEQTGNISSLVLDPLSDSETERLLQNLLGAEHVPEKAAARIAEAAEGNPLFVEETVQMLIDDGALREEAGRWVATPELAHSQVPPTIQAIVAARLDRMPSKERALIERASIAGRDFSTAVVSHLSPDQEQAAIPALLTSLTSKDLVRPIGPQSDGRYRFRHAAVQDTVYRSVPKATRADLHELYASWLEHSGGAEDEQAHSIGHHLEQAVRFRRDLGTADDHVRALSRKAVVNLAKACDRAMAVGDRQAAADLGERIRLLLIDVAAQPDSADLDMIARVGKLGVTLGDWDRTVALLTPYAPFAHPPILRDLGVALCKLHRDDPEGEGYRQGQRYLEAASTGARPDVDAVASFAGTYKGLDEQVAHRLYDRAVQLDRADPYALGNWLEYEVSDRGDLATVDERAHEIRAAIARCRRQAALGENLPWAFYDIGKFSLLLDRAEESLQAYAKAVQLSTAVFMLESALGSLERIASVAPKLQGYGWVRRLLLLGASGLFGTLGALRTLRRLALGPLEAPSGRIVIVAGGSHQAVEEEMQAYKHLLLAAFEGFECLVISGGTTHGVSGLVGDVQERYPATTRTLGYVPRLLPMGQAADADRYSEIRRTEGEDFGPLEPLQYWTDIVTSGFDPAGVRLLGIGGGTISAMEYRVALALGAAVGVVARSGRAADRLLAGREWATSRTLEVLPGEVDAVRQFLEGEC
jgi:class 3 adenylate cyclase